MMYHADGYEPATNTFVGLAAIASRTNRMHIGSAIAVLPRSLPWQVAREAAAIDQLSNGRMILRLGTLDSTTGGPMIHPVWYYFAYDRFFFFTDEDASKLRNVKRESAVYFTIDIDTRPYIGVRGKGTARVVPESEETIELKEKIVRKYLDRSNPRYNMAIEKARSNRSIVLEVVPSYTVWDYSKMSEPKA
ncbi:LLM class flavin-dependent oxidoreductase [Candidatus Bathyarchaeota archaeon]|nr:MAG: LLM class flavin-dependent oxidoreductase [Candidatus Bathyarchaeota archaeon]